MDYLAQHAATIFAAIASIIATLLSSVTVRTVFAALRKAKADRESNQREIQITREGIVQAFKEAVVTKDVKVSINKQVEKILTSKLDKFEQIVLLSEARRTKMTYWCLKILGDTAAYNKLTIEQKAEIAEILAMIAEEEQIVDTIER